MTGPDGRGTRRVPRVAAETLRGARAAAPVGCPLAVGSLLAVALLAAPAPGAAQSSRHEVTGLVLRVAADRSSLVVSHDDIPALMPAMTMPFRVDEARELDGVGAGMTVRFTLVLDAEGPRATDVTVVPYESVEQDPLRARRLSLLRKMAALPPAPTVQPSRPVPDFTLTNQLRQPVTLSQFRGQVVAINFIYTSCAYPQFCYRVTNQFGAVARRFAGRTGRDLVLLTISFDPARDTPERFAEYASRWDADPATWHFLTGEASLVERVCSMFGVDFFPDEGLMSHSVRTAIVDRDGVLVANIDGNRHSAAQLGDLIESVLNRRRRANRRIRTGSMTGSGGDSKPEPGS